MCFVMRNVVKAIRRRDMKFAARKYTFYLLTWHYQFSDLQGQDVLLIWKKVGQGPDVLVADAGWDQVIWILLYSHLASVARLRFSSFRLVKARYRQKHCFQKPLAQKHIQPVYNHILKRLKVRSLRRNRYT